MEESTVSEPILQPKPCEKYSKQGSKEGFKDGGRVHGYGARAHPLGPNLMSTHSLGHQSSGFGFATSLSGKSKTHGRLYCVAEDCSATLVEIANELGDPPFGQLIAFNVLPLASSHSGSLGSSVLLRKTDRRLAECFFPRLLIHFLQGFAYLNEGRFMSFQRLAKLNSTICRIPFLVLFNPICSFLRLSVHASTKTSNT
ncbi:hypothetical protein H5410_027809 [Solanum commersonii]|uniref:Uncharacterized protein n=1 Tax=Solanum commersonii TaxID=4109 RepID=A0A9J5Z299_SOLCO|nr:hypothetical protein H5410_027809 [Solanum commersonii]